MTELSTPSAAAHKPIAVRHVSKRVVDSSGELTILHDIDFEVPARQSVAIVGASGSGKSTLLSIMAGLDTPTQGTVVMAGEDLFALDEDARASWRGRHLGFVFQNFQLLPALDALEKDHAFLLRGGVFTPDVVEHWIRYKRQREVAPMRRRPHPYEFCLYYDA